MLRWAMMFLIVAVVAGVLGLTGIAGTAASIAKILFISFLVLFAITLVAGLAVGRGVSNTIKRERERDLMHH